MKLKAEGKNIMIPAVKYNTNISNDLFLTTKTTKRTTPHKNRHSRIFDVVMGENDKPIIVDEANIGTLQERLEGLCRLAQCRWPNLKHLELIYIQRRYKSRNDARAEIEADEIVPS